MRKVLFLLMGLPWLATAWGKDTTEVVVPFAYGNLDQWITREIHESAIIGGETKLLYEIGPTEKIVSNDAFTNKGGSPWANSNVMAKVAGVVKTNTSVYPEKRGA